MVYRYRLDGHDPEWKNTSELLVEYHDLPRGEYTFEVTAVDQDLDYAAEPVQVTVEVHLPYERLGWLAVTHPSNCGLPWRL